MHAAAWSATRCEPPRSVTSDRWDGPRPLPARCDIRRHRTALVQSARFGPMIRSHAPPLTAAGRGAMHHGHILAQYTGDCPLNVRCFCSPQSTHARSARAIHLRRALDEQDSAPAARESGRIHHGRALDIQDSCWSSMKCTGWSTKDYFHPVETMHATVWPTTHGAELNGTGRGEAGDPGVL